MPVVVRPRDPRDVDALVAVLAVVHEHDRYPIVGAHVEPGWILEPDGPAWVAELDGAVVGQVALQSGADPVAAEALGVGPAEALTLARFFVDPAARGTGAARSLLDAVESYAREARRPLALEVVAHNEAARTLYAGRGWTPLGPYAARWFGDDGPVFEAHRFVLPTAGAPRPRDVERSAT
ncbi:GNAT family N-acetyltransferase [Mumia sp. zg.B53]|uniref:GNAT family N-acetyltransferase n=2 Tax=unclassified Mumia TaxID=2621872 RepID=UPI001C6E0ABE|nr:GNAT family N-acetyltransferase [Mumia sp. zg.B53]MBW9214820.1 GNAT family N-acetyltransferase [Mumia sp. zg.B53]